MYEEKKVLTKADKANDDGGSGGDGSCIKPCGGDEATTMAAVEDVPCLDRRITAEAGLVCPWGLFWPKFRGKVAAVRGIFRLLIGGRGGGGGGGG